MEFGVTGLVAGGGLAGFEPGGEDGIEPGGDFPASSSAILVAEGEADLRGGEDGFEPGGDFSALSSAILVAKGIKVAGRRRGKEVVVEWFRKGGGPCFLNLAGGPTWRGRGQRICIYPFILLLIRPWLLTGESAAGRGVRVRIR